MFSQRCGLRAGCGFPEKRFWTATWLGSPLFAGRISFPPGTYSFDPDMPGVEMAHNTLP
jgi:hypothetical protein